MGRDRSYIVFSLHAFFGLRHEEESNPVVIKIL
jgi:hypothetical protein